MMIQFIHTCVCGAVRDQAIVIIRRRDMQLALILLAAFSAAVLLIISTYAMCNCLVLRHVGKKVYAFALALLLIVQTMVYLTIISKMRQA